MKRTHTLLTGGTGLLGRYLLRDLLLRGFPVAVLARSSGPVSAAERVEALLTHWERDLGRSLPRPVPLTGDVTEPGLGLSLDERAWIAVCCRRVLHGAASLTFQRTPSGEPWRSNFTGVQHVAQLCRELDVRELHHVSTAYVCGRRDGLILESETDVGQPFRNDYEKCKCAAEEWLRDQTDLAVTVYRPAVIVGDWHTGYTSTYHGLYRFFQFTWLLWQQARRDAAGRWHHPVRLRLSGQERRNLVPVDWVSAAIVDILGRPGCHGATYHLTPEIPTRSEDVEAALADYFLYDGVTFVGPDGLSDATLTDYERAFYHYVGNHEAYLTTEPAFDLTSTRRALPHLSCPLVDRACLRRLIDYGVRDRWGKGARRPHRGARL